MSGADPSLSPTVLRERAERLDADSRWHFQEHYDMHGNRYAKNCCENQIDGEALRSAAADLRLLADLLDAIGDLTGAATELRDAYISLGDRMAEAGLLPGPVAFLDLPHIHTSDALDRIAAVLEAHRD